MNRYSPPCLRNKMFGSDDAAGLSGSEHISSSEYNLILICRKWISVLASSGFIGNEHEPNISFR